MQIFGGNYFQVSNTIFCYNLSPIQLVVYSYLVSCAGQRARCYPSMQTIAACCRCSKNAARCAVDELARLGFIKKVKTFKEDKHGKRRQTNNTYYILEMPDLPPAQTRETFIEASHPA